MSTSSPSPRWTTALLGGLCGALLLGILWPSQPTAAGFAIGYVDTQKALLSHPRYAAMSQQLDAYETSRLKELEPFKKPNLTAAEQVQLMTKRESIREAVASKHDELMTPLSVELVAAIQKVGQASGVEVVIEAAAVHFGGIDLTPLVTKELK